MINDPIEVIFFDAQFTKKKINTELKKIISNLREKKYGAKK